ncbi:hypothetical protein B2G51_03820 [Leptospira santarosai]|nr:hypothetical protein B2G51_03820 [Leptospira santarosai]
MSRTGFRNRLESFDKDQDLKERIRELAYKNLSQSNLSLASMVARLSWKKFPNSRPTEFQPRMELFKKLS